MEKKLIKYTDMGNIKEFMYMDKLNVSGFPIKKISKNEYMVLDTGEIKEYNHTENRTENKDNLRKTFKKIRELINTNFTGAKNELAFTITYAENMKDTEKLYLDFKNFMKRLKYKYPNIDYINVVEPQGRGAWHCHVLLRFNDLEKIYIPNKEIRELWGNGFVSVKAMNKDVDNLGAYLSAYLGDVELTRDTYKEIRPGVIVKEVEINGKKKKFIKGGRLNLYPTGMNIYRCSRGIKNPSVSYIPYKDIKRIVGAGKPNYSSTIQILDDSGNVINNIQYLYYNLRTNENQR